MRVDHNEEVEVYDDLSDDNDGRYRGGKGISFPFDVTSKRLLKGEANIELSELSELSKIRSIPIYIKGFFNTNVSVISSRIIILFSTAIRILQFNSSKTFFIVHLMHSILSLSTKLHKARGTLFTCRHYF